MSTAAEVGKLVVRLMGNNKEYLTSLEQAQKATQAFVQDANGRFRNLKGQFVTVNEVIRSQSASSMQRLNAYGQAFQEWGRRGQQAAQIVGSIGRKMTVGITLPLTAGAGFAIKAAADFESSFAGIRKTVDATDEEFKMLEDGMRSMSQVVPLDVNELNKIGEVAGQLGIKTGNILKFTRTMADLGVSTNLSTEEAATSLARFVTITGSGQETVDRLGSTIVDLGNNFATTESEIVAFATRMAGAASLSGFTDAQIFGLGASLAQVGLEAEAGGTAMQKALLDIQTQVQSNGDQLGIYAATAGMTAEQFKQAWATDAAGAFTSFIQGLGVQGQEAISILQRLGVEDARSIRAFLALAGGGETLANAIDTASAAYEKNTALTEEANKRYATFYSQLKLLWNAIKDVAIELGQAMLPMVLKIIAALKAIVPYVAAVVKWFTELGVVGKTIIYTIVTIVAVIGPMLMLLGAVGGAVASLISLVGGLIATAQAFAATMAVVNISLGGLPIILGLIAAGIAAVAAWFGWLNWGADESVDSMDEFTKKAEEMAAKMDAEMKKAAGPSALAPGVEAALAQMEAKEKRAEESKKAIESLIADMAKENALFGLEGPDARIASLEYDLKAAGSDGMREADRYRLEMLAKELKQKEALKKAEEEILKVKKKAQDEYERKIESQAEQARQYLEDQLTPIEKLRQEIDDIWRLADVGALTSAQAEAIAQSKVSAFASSLGDTTAIKSAGQGVFAGSSEAMIAMRGNSGVSSKSVEDGVWDLVEKTDVELATLEDILAAIRENGPGGQGGNQFAMVSF